jgi:nucleoside-diphosphate-sugar epimerase
VKILLTGSNGFLGSFIKHELIKTEEIYTLSRSNADYNFYLDIDVPEFRENFDLIIHCAGKAHSIPKSEIESLEFFKTNVGGTNNLLKALSNLDSPKYFVLISSVSVYGLIEGENVCEESPLLAIDPYGKSKLDAEEIVTKWCRDNNVVLTILRLPLLIGNNPPGNLKAMINGIKKGYYFNVGGGNAKKSMVLASDVARYILVASKIGGTYNLTDGQHPTFNELSQNIANQFGRKFLPNIPFFFAKLLAILGDKLGRDFLINSNKLYKIKSSLTFNDFKARKAFGWNPIPILKGFIINE